MSLLATYKQTKEDGVIPDIILTLCVCLSKQTLEFTQRLTCLKNRLYIQLDRCDMIIVNGLVKLTYDLKQATLRSLIYSDISSEHTRI